MYVDNDLAIRRFTPPVGRIIHLVPGDEGRPLAHFASDLRRGTLLSETQLVLDRLIAHESQVQTSNGEWFVMRIIPYRTLDNYIGGAVITFTPINELKVLERRLQVSLRLAEAIVSVMREPLLALDAELRVLTLNPAFAALFGLDAAASQGRFLATLNGGAWQLPPLPQQLLRLLDPAGPPEFNELLVEADFPPAGWRCLRLYARRLPTGEDGQPAGLLVGVKVQ